MMMPIWLAVILFACAAGIAFEIGLVVYWLIDDLIWKWKYETHKKL